MTGLSFENVTKRYGGTAPAVAAVSLSVAPGELVALLGPSGSGKSTLLRLLSGLESPDEGRVRIGDRDVTDEPPRTRGVGMVFQSYALFEHMTAERNVAFGLEVRREKDALAQARALLARVGLADRTGYLPKDLSGGERQRVALARALAIEPAVLALDEPFSAVDPVRRAELREWVRDLRRERPITTILVTHDHEEAMELADRIAVMDGGRIHQVGTPEEIYWAPATEFVAGFVGSSSRLSTADGPRFVRPEAVRLTDGREARVEEIRFMGGYVRVVLALPDGQRLVAHVPPDQAPAQGGEVGLDWVI